MGVPAAGQRRGDGVIRLERAERGLVVPERHQPDAAERRSRQSRGAQRRGDPDIGVAQAAHPAGLQCPGLQPQRPPEPDIGDVDRDDPSHLILQYLISVPNLSTQSQQVTAYQSPR